MPPARLPRVLLFVGLSALSLSPGVQAQATHCEDLVWSALVLAENPDIARSCQEVYERNGTLYAQIVIEVVRARGNHLTFRPQHTDGTKGAPRSINVGPKWRANIDGKTYRAQDLLPGQQLRIYVPEDRFALTVHDGNFDGDEDLQAIEESDVVTLPDDA